MITLEPFGTNFHSTQRSESLAHELFRLTVAPLPDRGEGREPVDVGACVPCWRASPWVHWGVFVGKRRICRNRRQGWG
jgi:hypothetical protein